MTDANDILQGTAARASREIIARHVGDALATSIERDILSASIARVFTVPGKVGEDGLIRWEGIDAADLCVVIPEDDAIAIASAGGVLAVLSSDEAERLVQSLVSALEVIRARKLMTSGPVADLLSDFIDKFDGEQPLQ